VNKPRTYDVDELMKRFPVEERIYRLRCVEAWSMVIPWRGFALNQLLQEVEPTSAAKYVHFVSILDPKQMPGRTVRSTPGRIAKVCASTRLGTLDAHVHRTVRQRFAATERRAAARGGAVKYGFKSAKGIVKIELVAEQPRTLWSDAAPGEYGFYFQRQSRRAASALVAGQRAAHRRGGPPADADV